MLQSHNLIFICVFWLNIFTENKCKLEFCNKPVKNWRTQFCCRTHASQYSAFTRHKKIPTPRKTLKEIEKTKKPKSLGWEHRGRYPKDFVGPKLPNLYKFRTPYQKGKWISYVRARQMKIKQATPEWADKIAIMEIQKCCDRTFFYVEKEKLFLLKNPTKYFYGRPQGDLHV
jgi:hypothetical protein